MKKTTKRVYGMGRKLGVIGRKEKNPDFAECILKYYERNGFTDELVRFINFTDGLDYKGASGNNKDDFFRESISSKSLSDVNFREIVTQLGSEIESLPSGSPEEKVRILAENNFVAINSENFECIKNNYPETCLNAYLCHRFGDFMGANIKVTPEDIGSILKMEDIPVQDKLSYMRKNGGVKLPFSHAYPDGVVKEIFDKNRLQNVCELLDEYDECSESVKDMVYAVVKKDPGFIYSEIEHVSLSFMERFLGENISDASRIKLAEAYITSSPEKKDDLLMWLESNGMKSVARGV